MEYNEDMLLAKKNILALNEGLKMLQSFRNEDVKRIELLSQTISQLSLQLQTLTVEVSLLRVKALGHGSTVR